MPQYEDEYSNYEANRAEDIAYINNLQERDINNARQQEEQEPIDALEQFERGYTKTQLSVMASTVVSSALEHGNVLQMAEGLAAMETFIKEIRSDKRFTDYVREETAKTPRGYVAPSGAKIELAEVGTKYDFSVCGDLALYEMESKLTVLEDSIKKRKEFLKIVPSSGILFTDEETGETFKVYPPSKSSTSSFKITLAK